MSPASPGEATVAVVTRTRNRPVLLRRALDSVLSQTFSDFVLVVVNDAGDRDAVELVVKDFDERADGRITIVHNERSGGREAAMNTGIEATSSTYLTIHDDDDTWAPTFLEQTVAHLESAEDHGVATRTEVVFERVEGDTITVERSELLAQDKHDISLADMIRRNYAPPISLLYRRDVHDVVGPYDGSLPVLADWDFNLRFLLHFTIGFIDGDPLAFWHHRPTSVGDDGNSVITANDDHLRFETSIRNRYLRDDLQNGTGLGTMLYLTNLLERDSSQRIAHLDGVAAHLHKAITEAGAGQLRDELVGGLTGLVGELTEVNRNLVSQNNRIVAQFEAMAERVERLEDLVFSQTPRARLTSYKRVAAHRLHQLANRGR